MVEKEEGRTFLAAEVGRAYPPSQGDSEFVKLEKKKKVSVSLVGQAKDFSYDF